MDRRDEIYEKALELFVQGGYDHTPMSTISKALNLSKAGLYHYCTTKEELLFLIHENYLEKNFIPIIEKAEGISDPEKRIATFLKEYSRLIARDAAARVLIHEVGRLKAEHYQKIRIIWRRAFNLIRDTLSSMAASGKSKKVNCTIAAFAAIGMCSWTFYWFDYSRKKPTEELEETYVEIFLKGILR
jgi:AcrR family transcriptional regulator